MKLTKAQKEILEDVRTNGPQRYNGLMEKAIRSLERAGLVTVNYEVLPGVHKSRQRFTVTAKALEIEIDLSAKGKPAFRK